MNKQRIAYWITTALAAFGFFAGGMFDMLGGPAVVEALSHLGYPAYFGMIIGVWKVAGAVAIVVPGQPRLKEWAYAGMVFDLIGAAASHAFSGDGVGEIATPLVLLAIVLTSWALRPASRTIGSPFETLSDRGRSAPTTAPATV